MSFLANTSQQTHCCSKNLILIGFMGSGKSSIGRPLAKQLQYDYLDTDQVIASKVGKSIASIFESKGEAYFRDLETEVLGELVASSRKKLVLSTGGGVVLSEKNRGLIKSVGIVIWLHAAPEALFERAMRRPQRPLLEVEYPRYAFNQLLEQRLSLYQEAADIKLDTTELSYSKTIEKLLAELANT